MIITRQTSQTSTSILTNSTSVTSITYFLTQEFPFPLKSTSRIAVFNPHIFPSCLYLLGADKSLARPERKQARKHVRNARDFGHISYNSHLSLYISNLSFIYWGSDNSLDRPRRKQAVRDIKNMETRAVIRFFSCKARRRRKFAPFCGKQ